MDNDYGMVSSIWIRRVMALVVLAVVIFCVYVLVSSIITAETTGVLKVAATQKATISVSRVDGQAKKIGKPGEANIRLKPGTYQVVAITSNSLMAVRTVSIEKKQSVDINLTPTRSPKLPSVSSVSFFGMSALVDQGITSDQIDVLKLAFFRFKPYAGSVSINTQSIKTLPHNLGDPFVNTFGVAVDSQNYNAKVSYSDSQNIRLQLYNPRSGQLIFDSSPPAKNFH